MVSPERKRQAVLYVQCELEVSERWASPRFSPPPPRRATAGRQRCGGGPAWRSTPSVCNEKGSRCPAGKRPTGDGGNGVWSYDFVFDQTKDGWRLNWQPICDEFGRENVALEVERRMESTDVIRILDAAVAARLTHCQPPLFPAAFSVGVRWNLSAATTAPSLSRWRCSNGGSGAGSRPSTSPLTVRGRTPPAITSTAGFGTSS